MEKILDSVFPENSEEPKQKPFWINQKGFLMRSLTVTYFHRKYNRLSSAQKRFTVLFGMGRSGTTLLWPSGKGFVSLILARARRNLRKE